MRSEKEIREKLRKAIQSSRERAYQDYLSRKQYNCRYNDKGTCTISTFDPSTGAWKPTACVSNHDAEHCTVFQPKLDKLALKSQVDQEMAIPEICFRKHRDVAILQWVLEDAAPTPLTWKETLTETWLRLQHRLLNLKNTWK